MSSERVKCGALLIKDEVTLGVELDGRRKAVLEAV